MKKVALGLVMALLAAAPALALSLDGKTYSGSSGKEGSQSGQPDTFIFANGTFASSLSGHTPGAYQATQNGGNIEVHAETTNGADEKKIWTGAVNDTILDGRVKTYNKEALIDEGWFSANLVVPPAPPAQEAAAAPSDTELQSQEPKKEKKSKKK